MTHWGRAKMDKNCPFSPVPNESKFGQKGQTYNKFKLKDKKGGKL